MINIGKMSKLEIHFNFGSISPKPAVCFLSVKGNLMSKMLHEYFFDMQLFKNSEFGWIENQYLQLNINRCYKKNNPFYWRDELLSFILEFKQNLENRYFWSKIVFCQKKNKSIFSFCFK